MQRYEDIPVPERAAIRNQNPARFDDLRNDWLARGKPAPSKNRGPAALGERRYEDYSSREREAIHREDPARLQAMREDWVARGQPARNPRQTFAESGPVRYEDISARGREELYERDRRQYDSLREDWISRGKPFGTKDRPAPGSSTGGSRGPRRRKMSRDEYERRVDEVDRLADRAHTALGDGGIFAAARASSDSLDAVRDFVDYFADDDGPAAA